MQKKHDGLLAKAAEAAKTTPEKLAKRLRGLLSATRCRDTRERIITPAIMSAINLA